MSQEFLAEAHNSSTVARKLDAAACLDCLQVSSSNNVEIRSAPDCDKEDEMKISPRVDS